MWIEIIVGYVAFCVVVFFSLKIIEEFKSRKQIRRYREEDDIGRKPKEEEEVPAGIRKKSKAKSGRSTKGDGNSAAGKLGIQKRVEHAKRELLSS